MILRRKLPTGPYKDFAIRLMEALENAEIGETQKEIGDVFGVSQVTVAAWLAGEKPPSRDMCVKIARKVKRSTDWLLTGKEPFIPLPIGSRGETEFARKLPLISYTSAGAWIDIADPYELNDAKSWEVSPFGSTERDFLLQIQGDSMDDGSPTGYPDGCIAHFSPDKACRHKSDVVVRTPDGKTTFKQLHQTDESVYLVPRNPIYQRQIIEIPEGTVICAVALGFWVDQR